MGLFDTIVNSYKPLGVEFLNKTLQTKSLHKELNYYWLSPNGELFEYDTSMCYTWGDIDERFYIHKIKTGEHGKISPCYITKKIVAYSGIEPNDTWTNVIMYFKLGQLITYSYETYKLENLNAKG